MAVGIYARFWQDAQNFRRGKTECECDIDGYDCGQVVKANAKEGLFVKVFDGVVRLKEIQLEGAKRMCDTAFLLGRSVEIGTKFE